MAEIVISGGPGHLTPPGWSREPSSPVSAAPSPGPQFTAAYAGPLSHAMTGRRYKLCTLLT